MPRGSSELSRSSGGGRRISSSALPAPALASHLNAAVMQQQLGKSSVPQCVPGPRAARVPPAALRAGRRTNAPATLPCETPVPGHCSVARGRNWAPSDGDSSDEDAPRNAVAKRSGNPFQPLLDVMFKPMAELLCPMLMPASNDTLVREYCEELEKDRSVLAQQNVALEKELEKLKLSAAKRQRGKRTKDEQLDRFLDLRVMVRRPRSRQSHAWRLTPLRRRWATRPMAVQRTTWPSRCGAALQRPCGGGLTLRRADCLGGVGQARPAHKRARGDARCSVPEPGRVRRVTRRKAACAPLTRPHRNSSPSANGNGSDAGSARGSSLPRTLSRNSEDVAALMAMARAPTGARLCCAHCADSRPAGVAQHARMHGD